MVLHEDGMPMRSMRLPSKRVPAKSPKAGRRLRASRKELNNLEAKEFERQLAAAYTANAKLNRAIAAEFAAAEEKGDRWSP